MKELLSKSAEELVELAAVLLKQANKNKNKPLNAKVIEEMGDVTAIMRILNDVYGSEEKVKEIADLKEIKYRAKYEIK